MEDLDRQILRLLAADGRMSFTDLGRQTGLSTSAVHQRVRRLEQRGVIRGYHADVDPGSLGLPLTAFVAVSPLNPAAHDGLPKLLAEFEQVEACYSVAGDESYLIKLRARDTAALELLLGRIRSDVGVTTRTTIVLSTSFEARSLPV
ncbi:Lrp/AsnC family transcriptional regulator [Spongisporangium articulatum]|uniref:Lrp/AsnC family transcriptional regulator n=1 Tax=Spongisporangium articulatum TaxID=3362603 RepID=A0ABW8ASM6_9ACTN